MKINAAQLWLGSQQSYEQALEAQVKAEADSRFKAGTDYEEEVIKQMLHVQDGVAVVNIKGSLVSGSAGYGVYYGVTGYDDIRAALSAAVANPNVSSILLDVGSGGGHVAGVHENAQLIARINKIKPVVTYTGSMMGSAAVWTGVSGSYVVASETAIVGSIGIVMVHSERSKMLEEAGIKITVIRAGSEKALASPYEPLSDQAKANLEAQAKDLYDIFIKHVADSRGVAVAVADEKFGQGREFLAKAAKQAGLIDKVGSYEDAFAYAMKLGAATKRSPAGRAPAMRSAQMSAEAVSGVDINAEVQGLAADTVVQPSHNPATPQGSPMKKPLTEAQLAAMAAGVVLDGSETPDTETAPAAETATETTPEANTGADTEAAPTAGPAVAELMEKLATANAELVTVKAELDSTKESLVAAKAEFAEAEDKTDLLSKLSTIARNSVKTMGVHFGVKSDTVAAMSDTEVLAEHARLAGLFTTKFKVGGVAAVAAADKTGHKDSTKPSFMAPAQASVAMTLPGA